MKRSKTIDWRFWVALSASLMVFYLLYSANVNIQESRKKDERITHIMAYTKDLAERNRELLAYIEKNDIEVPTRLINRIQSPESSEFE